jgi:hypothetical protein
MEIPAETLKTILALRKENGLEPTEAALKADLQKSKAKWKLTETPRYRRAGRSPLFVSGKYLSSAGTDPATGEPDAESTGKVNGKRGAAGAKPPTPASTKLDDTVFYKVLHGKGFAVKISKDMITGEIDTQLPSAISKLDLQFGKIPETGAGVYVIQTSPQVQVAMPLDRFLELAGIKA